MIKAVLFDFGGTLVQPKISWPEIKKEGIKATYAFLRKNGLRLTFDEYSEVNARIFKKYSRMEASKDRDIPDELKYQELINEFFPSLARHDRQRLASETNDVFWELTARAQTPSKNVRRCLRNLRALGLQMAVISNHHNHKALEMMLKVFKLREYFKVVIASEAVRVRKPNPKIFRICLTRLGFRRSQAVFVGDSLLYDIAGAKDVGLMSVLYLENDPVELRNPRDRDGVETSVDATARPDFIVGDLSGLPRLIRTLNERIAGA